MPLVLETCWYFLILEAYWYFYTSYWYRIEICPLLQSAPCFSLTGVSRRMHSAMNGETPEEGATNIGTNFFLVHSAPRFHRNNHLQKQCNHCIKKPKFIHKKSKFQDGTFVIFWRWPGIFNFPSGNPVGGLIFNFTKHLDEYEFYWKICENKIYWEFNFLFNRLY